MTLRPILTLKVLLVSSCLFVLHAESPKGPNAELDHELAETYIRDYLKVAIDEMERVGMPASVIIAQGMLESSYGQSELAQTSNNHFGIKCHKGWTGETYYHRTSEYSNDRMVRRRECFRAYEEAKASYRDHSEFLTSREHYKFLFDAKTLDYKFWAKGLVKAKYATDPQYANKLIRIIEKYDLSRYDKVTHKYRTPDHKRIQEFNADPTIEINQDVLALNTRVYYLEQSLKQAKLYQQQVLELQKELKRELLAIRHQQENQKEKLNEKIQILDQALMNQHNLIADMSQQLSKVEAVQKSMLVSDPLAAYFEEDGTPKKQIDIFPTRHRNADGIFYQSGRKATALAEGQSFEEIAKIYDIDIKDLRKYNDLEVGEEDLLQDGCYIFLEPKANNVTGETGPHTVQAGENLHSISQRYGIKVAKLQQRNRLKKGEEPAVGEFIFLNENNKEKPSLRYAAEDVITDSFDGFGGGGSNQKN